MIDEFFILRRDGLSIFHIRLDEDSFAIELPTELFAGFSSAIVAFTAELGAGHLSKIEIEDQKFVYEVNEDLITCAKISENDDESMAKHVVAILYREFMNQFGDEIKDYNGTVRRDIFFPFADTVKEITTKCEKIASKNPHLLENIPPSINIDAILELSDFSEELIDNFPEATIRLTRAFQEKLPDGMRSYTMFKLGLEVGKEIMNKKFRRITERNINKLLNEISVCTRDDDIITLRICPFCRGRETEEFDCDFVAGFIEGAYDNKKISVREISCHAVGDKYCRFRVFHK